MDAFFDGPPQRKYRPGKIGVGQRAVRHGAAACRDQGHVGGGDEVGVRQHGLAGEEAKAIKACRIGLLEADQPVMVGPIALRTVGLNVAVAFGGQLPQADQDFVGA